MRQRRGRKSLGRQAKRENNKYRGHTEDGVKTKNTGEDQDGMNSEGNEGGRG